MSEMNKAAMISIEEVPVERIEEFWGIHIKYMLDDGIITEDEDVEYFSGDEHRGNGMGHHC